MGLCDTLAVAPTVKAQVRRGARCDTLKGSANTRAPQGLELRPPNEYPALSKQVARPGSSPEAGRAFRQHPPLGRDSG